MTIEDTWYTITVVHHTGHPQRVADSNPTDVIAATLLPNMAATVLRGVADEISPKKPVMRRAPAGLPSED